MSLSSGVEQAVWKATEKDDFAPSLTFGLGVPIPLGGAWSIHPGFSGEWQPGSAVLLGFQVGIGWSF